MTQQTKLGTAHTSLWISSDGWTRVKYRDTVVIRWNEDEIVLDSGGFRTAMTKLRMNQASNQFGLDIHVHQSAFTWFVALPNEDSAYFTDGMTISRSVQAKRQTG